MAKPNKRKVAEALARWRAAQGQKGFIEAQLAADLKPLRAAYDAEAAPFVQAADKALKPVNKEIAELEKQISDELLDGVADGVAALPQVVVEGAIAEVAFQVQREIEPQAWIEAVPPESRESKFWSCVKVLIGNVEKHFGTQYERLFQKSSKPRVQFKLVDAPAAVVVPPVPAPEPAKRRRQARAA